MTPLRGSGSHHGCMFIGWCCRHCLYMIAGPAGQQQMLPKTHGKARLGVLLQQSRGSRTSPFRAVAGRQQLCAGHPRPAQRGVRAGASDHTGLRAGVQVLLPAWASEFLATRLEDASAGAMQHASCCTQHSLACLPQSWPGTDTSMPKCPRKSRNCRQTLGQAIPQLSPVILQWLLQVQSCL